MIMIEEKMHEYMNLLWARNLEKLFEVQFIN